MVVRFHDDTWLEGYFKDGVLHGFGRYYDAKNRLTFVGMHRNGKPFGTCWKVGVDPPSNFKIWVNCGQL